MKTKQEIYETGEYIYYPVGKGEHIVDLVFSFLWNIGLVATVIHLVIRHSPLWLLLLFFVWTAEKISKRRID